MSSGNNSQDDEYCFDQPTGSDETETFETTPPPPPVNMITNNNQIAIEIPAVASNNNSQPPESPVVSTTAPPNSSSSPAANDSRQTSSVISSPQLQPPPTTTSNMSRMASQISSEYCFEYDQPTGSETFETPPVSINYRIKEDINRARAYLGNIPGLIIEDKVVGNLLWVTVTFRLDHVVSGLTAKAWGFDVMQPISLRLELDPEAYTATQLPPRLKITQNDSEFLVGQQLVRIMTQYFRRCWSLRDGFTPCAASSTLAAALAAGIDVSNARAGAAESININSNKFGTFEVDVDPRCVEPYMSEEGGFITHAVRYLILRLKTCSTFCVLCDQPHLFAVSMLRPAVCSRAVCVFAFHEMKVGSDSADNVAADSDVVELLTVMFLAAVNSSRADQVLVPFPSVPGSAQNTLALNPDRPDYDKAKTIAMSLPSPSLLKKTVNYSDLREKIHKSNALAFPLLNWIIASNRSFIVKVPLQVTIPSLQTPDQFLLVTSTPEKEETFKKRAKQSGTFLAFHGSRAENWHAILRQGLKNYSGTKNQLNGAAHGTGIYFGKDAATSLGYSSALTDEKSGSGSPGQNADDMKWDSSICVCVCEIVKGAEKDHGWCWTVVDEDAVMTRLFFVFRTPPPKQPTVTSNDKDFVVGIDRAMAHFDSK